MSKPIVSVVMAVCNVERFLAEAIESILNQTFTDFEFQIVDYGSTDNSKSIISSYAVRDGRVKYREMPPCDLPVARNASCALAQGEFIAIMDADDISLPDRLSREVEYLQRHPQVSFIGGAVEWIDSSGRPFHIHRHPSDERGIKNGLLTHNVFWHPTVFMRKDAFVSVGGYRSVFVCSHDYDLALRISDKYECANLDEVLVKYRVHPIQLTADRHIQQSLCKLAAQASAAARRAGRPDLLDTVREINPATLASLGVGETEQRNSVVSDGRAWIRNLMTAGEFAAALAGARRILASNLDQVEPWQVSELYLSMAELYWREKKVWKCIASVAHAVLARPVVIGRPLKPLLQRLGLA